MLAMTNYGFCGPMTDMATVFDDKEAPIATGGGLMTMMGIGCWLFWLLNIASR